MPESRDPKPGAFDLVGAGLSVATLATLVYSIIEATPRGWADPLVLAGFAAAAALGALFILWERRVASPMLPLRFFADPRFTVASLGVALVFFAMMGSVFAFTQFLQFAHGYSALEAGAAMLPLALGLVIGSGASNKLVGRVRAHAGDRRRAGRRRGGAEHEPAVDVSMAPALLALVTFGLALSMGAAMAPATDSVMSAVPEAKAGVGSAMSDVTRQVGGALGVAVIGSLIGSAYSRRHATARRASRASRSARLTPRPRGSAARPGEELAATAGRAFTDALGIGLTAAAVVALVGAVLVAVRLPRVAVPRHRRRMTARSRPSAVRGAADGAPDG